MRKPVTILVVLFLITLCLSLLKIVVANSTVSNGIELGIMQSEISDLDTQNLVLQEKLLSYSSLHTIDAKAEKMGLTRAKDGYFVAAPQKVAINQ